MKLYRPVKTNWINQGFGENLPCSPEGKTTPVITGSPTSCPIGYTKLYPKLGLKKGHNGIDLSAYHGEPIYHSANWAGWMWTEVDKGGGIGVRVISNEPQLDGKHVLVLYWHLKSVVGYDEKEIKPGDLIGYADSTGYSSGDHVHWALKTCKVTYDENGHKHFITLNSSNGFGGAIDQTPYFVNTFILDFLGLSLYLTKIQMLRELLAKIMLLITRK